MDSILHGPVRESEYLQCLGIGGGGVGGESGGGIGGGRPREETPTKTIFRPAKGALPIAAEASICMISYNCGYQFCDPINFDYNLPLYTLDARSEEDIAKAIDFASKWNIEISVKTSGYSLQGSSTKRDSLLIWMRNFPKDDEIQDKYAGEMINAQWYKDFVSRLLGLQILTTSFNFTLFNFRFVW